MVKRYLRKIRKNITFMNFIVCLFVTAFIFCILLIFYPDELMFGSFKISKKPITLGEIGGFIGGILSPLVFVIIFLTLKAQQDEARKSEKRHWDAMISKINDEQPKLNFRYDSYHYDADKFELTFNFLVINIGKEALDFTVSVDGSPDEDDLSNFLNSSALNLIPNYSNDNNVVLKLTFICIAEDSIKDSLSINLFCHYNDVSLVGRAFYAKLNIYPRLDIGFKAEIEQIDRAI